MIACFFTKSILHKSVFTIKEIECFIKHVGTGGILRENEKADFLSVFVRAIRNYRSLVVYT